MRNTSQEATEQPSPKKNAYVIVCAPAGIVIAWLPPEPQRPLHVHDNTAQVWSEDEQEHVNVTM